MKISDKDKEYLLSLKPEDLDFKTLVSLFGNTTTISEGFSNRKSRFETTDTFTLTPNDYYVKEPTETTVGKFIFNKYLYERFGFEKILGYVNEPITDGRLSAIEGKLSKALINDKIELSTFHEYINYRDTLGMQMNSVITTSFTPKTVTILPEVKKKREELFKKYEKELSEGDVVVSKKIENELVTMSKDLLKNDKGLDLYNSEARGNFGNYKNMNIFKGLSVDPSTGNLEFIKSSFMDGIQKQDVASFATAIVSGAFPKAVRVVWQPLNRVNCWNPVNYR